jgi:hypothetical protein
LAACHVPAGRALAHNHDVERQFEREPRHRADRMPRDAVEQRKLAEAAMTKRVAGSKRAQAVTEAAKSHD